MTVSQPKIQSIPGTRVAAKSFRVARPEEVTARIGPAFDQVWDALHEAGVEPGLPIAWYAMDDTGLDCWAGFESTVEAAGAELVDVPEVAEAVVVRVVGGPSQIMAGWQAVSEWLEANGAAVSAPGREVYLANERGDQDSWVTEVQQPFTRG